VGGRPGQFPDAAHTATGIRPKVMRIPQQFAGRKQVSEGERDTDEIKVVHSSESCRRNMLAA
jgi:hypothetical protein